MATEQTLRIISKIFDAFDLYEEEKLTEESLMECIDNSMGAIENPDLSLVEEIFIELIAFLDEASYVVPYSKKRASIVAELKRVRLEVSKALTTEPPPV